MYEDKLKPSLTGKYPGKLLHRSPRSFTTIRITSETTECLNITRIGSNTNEITSKNYKLYTKIAGIKSKTTELRNETTGILKNYRHRHEI